MIELSAASDVRVTEMLPGFTVSLAFLKAGAILTSRPVSGRSQMSAPPPDLRNGRAVTNAG